MRRLTLIILLIIAVILGIYFYARSRSSVSVSTLNNPAGNGNAQNSENIQNGSATNSASNNAANTPPPANTNSNSQAVSPITHTVSITDTGFVPASVTINIGDSVKWVNNSSAAAHPASNPHPTHTGYPTTGGCVGSTFDACTELAPGQSWTFKFDITGTWGYHDHDNPGKTGTVIVK